MTTDNKITTARSAWLRAQDEHLMNALGRCESPIEQLFLLALLNTGWEFPPMHQAMEAMARAKDTPGFDRLAWSLFRDDSDYVAYYQASLKISDKSYRVDFAFLPYGEPTLELPRVVVELDGHDFHERTKEQARRDKARDRAMATAGWRVLRYTGSEIYANAENVATEVFWVLAGGTGEP